LYLWLSVSLNVVCDILGDVPNILASITRLKSDLVDIIEPDFGLLDELLRREVLTDEQRDDVRSQESVCDRNSALLDLLVSEDQCDKFVKALHQTGQQHVFSLIVQNGGQQHCIVVKLSVLSTVI